MSGNFVSNDYLKKKQRINNTVITLLTIALLGTWIYILFDKNNQSEENQEKEQLITNTSQERDLLLKDLEAASGRFDELKTLSSKKDSTIYAKDREINEKITRIQSLLSKVNTTQAQLSEARSLISGMNTDIDGYKKQIELLEGKNIQLTREKEAVTIERDQVIERYDSASRIIRERDELIDIGSTLQASKFNILGIREKSGGKEKITDKAQRVDKLRISFDINENLITPSGSKQLFVIISDPSGKVISDDNLGSGLFTTREGEEKTYTQLLDVNYVQGKMQTISFDWKKTGSYSSGNYKIEVYNNGFRVGESYCPLKR